MIKRITLYLLIGLPLLGYGQGFDSTQIGKEYPYLFPILGKKAYTKGYKLQLPHGVMLNSLVTNQNIVLENMHLAFQLPGEMPPMDEDFLDLSEILIFGDSKGRVSTLNLRVDTWILPFLSIGGYYGRAVGEQKILIEAPVKLESVTDINGEYWGLNILGLAPVGPIVLAVDYSQSFTTNERLDDPVKVAVVGLRVIKNWPIRGKEDMFIGAWVGAQFQKLEDETSGHISMEEALDPDGSFQQDLDDWYNGLSDLEQALYGDRVYEAMTNLTGSTVYYTFDKRLENNWGSLFGAQWQINRHWQLRTELSFSQSKQQGMLSLNYRFGL